MAVLTFALGASACRAASPTAPSAGATAPAAPQASATLTHTRFMAFGDSITAGEVTVPATTSVAAPSLKLVQVLSAAYPTVLLQLLRSGYPSQFQDLVVFNEGRGAEQAEFALPRFTEMFNRNRPDVVLLMEGYNDICCGNGPVGVRAGEKGVGAMAAEARLGGARVFIATLAPTKRGQRQNNPETVLAFNERLHVVADSEGAVLVDVYGALLPDVEHNIGVDGLHPTEIGYRRIAEAFFAAIQRELEIR